MRPPFRSRLEVGRIMGFTILLMLGIAGGISLFLSPAVASKRPRIVRTGAYRSAIRPEVDSRPGTAGARPEPRQNVDTSGFSPLMSAMSWPAYSTLDQVAEITKQVAPSMLSRARSQIDGGRIRGDARAQISGLLVHAMIMQSEREPGRAYEDLVEARTVASRDETLKSKALATIIYFQGVAAMRRGENENCIDCRGESSCILPIAESAVHRKTSGSETAIRHFTEYLALFPDDQEVRWLLNVAHMTLGTYPEHVDSRYLISLDRFTKSEFDIGRFRDVGAVVGVNKLNQAGAAIMEDFDNDGLLDLAVSSFDPTAPLSIYRNRGDGTFQERGKDAGVSDQLGGLICVQADYDNDGFMDIFVARGAWLSSPIRPSLLRNKRDGTFEDVTEAAGLLEPVNTNSASWGDYDGDGWIDLFICCERQPNRLYRNRRDGTFEEVGLQAGLAFGDGKPFSGKGSTWIDIDNDDHPDLFLNNLAGTALLYRNNGDGTFKDVTGEMGIDGPKYGFSCWAWDYDNDGWLDLFATSYERGVGDVVRGLEGKPHGRESGRLFRNRQGHGFEDRSREAGLDAVYACMGSNFADFDNDGYPDFYLGTGDPSFATLIPNRMFRNVAGERFAEITGTSGTGHLQKGHGVACGDWDRDGDVDVFIQTGGAVNGDKYHNILFQNPGQANRSLTVRLHGTKTNRAAIGARIKAVTAGPKPLTVHLLVSSGSSFGANPLEQTIGLGTADRIAALEVHWPVSRTTQVFHDLPAGQVVEITELSDVVKSTPRRPLSLPE
ncbi:CRTAC1 family protein [Aquisphaera insulae]|uniref:CRTAC1 family protein n=1 Tax=Aquisphaera insulae TaxID=2712864 RepID=UPI0013ED8940|nr:CRTAC1 family protein [Aquisphaera insulae]